MVSVARNPIVDDTVALVCLEIRGRVRQVCLGDWKETEIQENVRHFGRGGKKVREKENVRHVHQSCWKEILESDLH